MSISILLVDDHPMFRKGLRLLLEAEKDIRVVGEAGDGRAALEQVRELSPDVVIMDISMPELNGTEATRRILSDAPNTKVVALSIHAGKRFVKDMLSAGASGYILKDSVPEEMITGIRKVMQNEVYLSSAITGVVVSEFLRGGMDESAAEAPGQWVAKESTVILRTKLHRPSLSPDFVPRSDLVARLDELRCRPVTLVSSAAGYGKSTMASLWLEAWGGPYGWVSLDADENDLRMFLNYLLAAIRKAFPKACDTTHSLLLAPEFPPASVLGRHLLNDLDQIEVPFILVLDDYHKIREQAVHDLMAAYMTHPPKSIHLMLLTRRDPPLLTSTLRGRSQVNEIGTFDLQFTAEETAVFLKNTLGLSIDGKTAATIQEKLEGWPAGMRLLSQSLKYSGDLDRLIAGLKGGFAAIVDYLVAEVLSQQSPEITRLMTTTAILDRFCASVCDVLSGADGKPGAGDIDGDAFIAWLQKENLFLIPLDTENRWFRYHHLFQDLLQSQLKHRCSSEEIAALHSRASEWFAENGLIDEALQLAIAADDLPYAVKLVEQHRYDFMNREQWHRLARWLDMLPPETVEKNPILLSTRAYVFEYHGRVAETFAYRDRAEGLLSTLQPQSLERKALQGEIAVLHGEQHILSGDGDLAVACSERALKLLPPEALHIWSYAIGEKVLANQMAGDISRGLRIINEILNEHASLPGISEARMMLWFCMAFWMEGDLIGLKQQALRCLKLGEQCALPESISFGRYFLGVLHYVRNELSEAEQYLAAVVDDPFTARPRYLAHSAFALALIHIAQGRDEDASNVVESLISHTMETNDTSALATARASQVELALRQRKIPEAQRLNTHAAYDLLPPNWVFYVPQLTPVKLLLAQHTSESLEKALTLLDQVDGFVRKTNRKSIRIDVLALQALILDAQGKEPAAIEKLTELLALAEPGGFIRNFVDLGPPMAGLLKRLQKQNVAVDYIEKLLAAFPEYEPESRLEASNHNRQAPQHLIPPSPSHPTPQSLAEPLTNRELDVLELLAQRLQNKEIADKLFVSPETVKGHLKSIYQKLGVGNRRQAVEKAKKIGIL